VKRAGLAPTTAEQVQGGGFFRFAGYPGAKPPSISPEELGEGVGPALAAVPCAKTEAFHPTRERPRAGATQSSGSRRDQGCQCRSPARAGGTSAGDGTVPHVCSPIPYLGFIRQKL